MNCLSIECGGGGELPLCTVRENLGENGVEFYQDSNAFYPTEFRTVIEGILPWLTLTKREKYL